MWTQRDPKDNICWSCEVVSDFAGLTVIVTLRVCGLSSSLYKFGDSLTQLPNRTYFLVKTTWPSLSLSLALHPKLMGQLAVQGRTDSRGGKLLRSGRLVCCIADRLSSPPVKRLWRMVGFYVNESGNISSPSNSMKESRRRSIILQFVIRMSDCGVAEWAATNVPHRGRGSSQARK